jgi:hypothetical protein
MLINTTCIYLQDHYDKMVAHIACLTGTTEEEVRKEFMGDYSILVPILARVTRLPAPVSPPRATLSMLQYLDRTEDEEDEDQ